MQEEFVERYRQQIMNFWEEFSPDMVTKVPSMTLENFKYARGLVSTAWQQVALLVAVQLLPPGTGHILAHRMPRVAGTG